MRHALFKNIPKATNVWYSAIPPLLGGTPVKITIQELYHKLGYSFEFSENIYTQQTCLVNPPENFDLTHQANITPMVLKKLNSPVHDSLVVCKIDDKVGHGVFTREPIKYGEVVAIYSGEIKKNHPPSLDKQEYQYSLGIDSSDKQERYSIDAINIGGIARFIEHLPQNNHKLTEQLLQLFRSDETALERYVKYAKFSKPANQEARQGFLQVLKSDILHGTGEQFKCSRGIVKGQDSDTECELQNSTFKDGVEIAYSNLEVGTIFHQQKPIVFLHAARNISVGEQLGYSYGASYWRGINQLPRFFDLKGQTISYDQYSNAQMPLTFASPASKQAFTYSREQYFQNFPKKFPVILASNQQMVSFYWLREHLANNNVIDTSHLPLAYDTTATLILKDLFPDAKVKAFRRSPESKNPEEHHIIDVVCTFPSLEQYKKALQIFSESCLRTFSLAKAIAPTQEIIVYGVNLNTDAMKQFISKITKQNECGRSR